MVTSDADSRQLYFMKLKHAKAPVQLFKVAQYFHSDISARGKTLS